MRLHSHKPTKQLIPRKTGSQLLRIYNVRTLKNVLVEILMGYLLSLMENIELKQMIHIYLY